jgi:2-polyprenyl-6-methoxyphenol hydroxylase-like FAD-dependent oxidoreductase
MTVLVVGAGPTGLTLACELARRDVPVRIVDRAPEPFPGSRGKSLQPRTLEIFDDLGVVDETLTWGIPGIRFRSHKAGQPPEDSDPQGSQVVTPAVPYPKGVIIPQWRTERILRSRLASFGVEVEQSAELVSFEQTTGGVEVTLAGAEPFSVDYLVGCDGGHSLVRKALGVGFAGETAETGAMIIGDVEVTGLPDDRWHMWFGERGFMSLCPFAGVSSWQLQAVVDPLPAPSLEAFRRIFADVAGLPGVTLDNPTWVSTYRVNERIVDTTRVGRVFLAGDAAHVHSPAGGLGMNTGIQDAYNLGWKLAAVLRGEADEDLLDTYQEERLPIAEWTLSTSNKRLAGMVTGFTSGKNGFLTQGGPEVRQLGLGYRWSGLSSELVDRDREGLLRAGDRAPDAPCVSASGEPVRLFDLFRGPHYTLLGFGSGCAAAVRGVASAHLIAPDGDVVDASGYAVEAYGITEDTLVLVRPDGYVAVIASPADVAAVRDHPGWRRLDPSGSRSIRSST